MPNTIPQPDTSIPTHPRLVGDIGGTNARFGWVAAPGAAIEHVGTLPAADHATLADAARAYLAAHGLSQPAEMAFGIASPITGDDVRMTNHHWSFSIAAMKAELGLQRLKVLNDFTALALALPSLQQSQSVQLGGGAARAGAPIALLGAGTGLGVSGLLQVREGHWLPLSGEGGHVTLAGTNAREDAVIDRLRVRFGHASAERAVSGCGLVNLALAVSQLDGVVLDDAALTPAAVTTAALAADARRRAGQTVDAPLERVCLEALELFCAFFGTVAGNLVLTLGAFGGAYIGGGIVPRLGDFFERSAFRARFEAKGRYTALMAAVPVFVIRAEVSPALEGAARALDQPD